MLSNCRSRFLLLACCALFALLLMGAGAASSTSTRMPPSTNVAMQSTAFVVDSASLTDSRGGWHSTSPDQSPNGLVARTCDGDIDDVPVLPVSVDFRLDHPRFDTPVGVILPLRTTSAAPLPRPPDLV